MSGVRITSFNGSRDGIRWGDGWRPQDRSGAAHFQWSYDMIGDVFRVWTMTAASFGASREIHPAWKDEAAQLVRGALGRV